MSLKPVLPDNTDSLTQQMGKLSINNTTSEANSAAAFDFATYQAQQGIHIDERYQTEDVTYEESVTFQSMGLSLPLLKGIADCGFRAPSPIQAQAIPQILLKNNVIARAKNGTGKTAAFCIPIVQQINPASQKVQAVIMASTRELVTQITEFLSRLTKHLPIKILGSYGGTDFKFDVLALQQGVHILVSTSGRIETIARQNFLKDVKICAIDEADKFFSDNAYEQTHNLITRTLPSDCKKVLFSATYPHTMQARLNQLVPDAEFVNTMDEITLRGVTQHYVVVEEKDKVKCLKQLIDLLKVDQCIIFCCSPQRAEALAQRMSKKWQIPCFSISGSLAQSERTTITQQFRNKAFKFLIATDVLARGFDMSSLNVVINFDLTPSCESYLHRIGRSGRFGHIGLAINLVNPDQASLIAHYEKKLGTQITQLPKVIDHDMYASDVPAPQQQQAAAAQRKQQQAAIAAEQQQQQQQQAE